jgi:hypothetical protein
MVKTALVSLTDAEIQGLVLQALSRTQIPVTFCDWNYVEQLGEAQLIIATPWYDSKGPRAAYSAVIDALLDAGVYEEIPIRRVYLKSPRDPLIRALEQEGGEAPEGFLHILRHRDGSYSLVFAPLSGPGGPVPAKDFSGKDEAQEFLKDKLPLSPRAVEEAFLEVAQYGSSAIVARLKLSQLRRWGLAQSHRQPKSNKKPATHRRKDSDVN